jgi:hypothetical protein
MFEVEACISTAAPSPPRGNGRRDVCGATAHAACAAHTKTVTRSPDVFRMKHLFVVVLLERDDIAIPRARKAWCRISAAAR